MKTANDFLLERVREIKYKQPNSEQLERWLIEFAIMHVEEALKTGIYSLSNGTLTDEDKNKIFNAYPLENIK